MAFNYEQSIWGKGEASLRWSDPTGFRLHEALESIKSVKSIKDEEITSVLEVGCGAGQFIRAVKRLRPELDCYGADISLEAIALAKDNNDGVSYALSESKKLPYADGSMDAVLIFDVLEHVEDPAGLVDEIRRVLKSGGIFYCFVPCEGDALSMWNWLRKIGVGGDLTQKHAGHINYFSRASLRQLFLKSSWQMARIHYSEHLFGQLLGIAAFVLMDRAAKRQGDVQINNETYFTANGEQVSKILKNIVNSLVYLESSFLKYIPSPNVHLVVRKI